MAYFHPLALQIPRNHRFFFTKAWSIPTDTTPGVFVARLVMEDGPSFWRSDASELQPSSKFANRGLGLQVAFLFCFFGWGGEGILFCIVFCMRWWLWGWLSFLFGVVFCPLFCFFCVLFCFLLGVGLFGNNKILSFKGISFGRFWPKSVNFLRGFLEANLILLFLEFWML